MNIAKKKRVSKKNKSDWRKHADIQDVEDFLEDQRLEERIGKFSEKEDSELFIVDNNTTVVRKPILSNREKRKQNARREPKNMAIFKNTSKVEDPLVQRDQRKQKKNGKDILAQILDPNGSERVQQSNKDRMKFYGKLDTRLKKKRGDITTSKDIWEEGGILEKYPEFKNDWISKTLVEYHLMNTGRPAVKVQPSIRKKMSRLDAFETPHPGMSYNPTLKDHNDLLEKVIEREEGFIKEEKHLKRVTTAMFSKVTEEERDRDVLKTLSEGMDGENNEIIEEKEDDEDDGEPYISVNAPVQNKKKLRKQRRNVREQKDMLQERKKIKLEKKKITDIHRLRHVTGDVLQREEELNKLKKRKKELENQKQYSTKQLGKNKFIESEVDVNMPHDISGNLRNIKQESSLLLDRFKSLQKRNLLVATTAANIPKKRQVKRFARKTHSKPTDVLKKKKRI